MDRNKLKGLVALGLMLAASVNVCAQTDTVEAVAGTENMKQETVGQNGTMVIVSRFGYLSYNEALRSMPEYGKAQEKLKVLKKQYADELARSEKEFSRQYAEYVDGQKDFPDNILLKRQKELQQLLEQGLEFKEQAKRLLEQAESELMMPINQKLKEVLARLGSQRGYAYILNTDNNSYPFINGELGEDITADVIAEVTK